MRFRNPAGHAGLLHSLLSLVNSLAGFLESRIALFANESKTALVQVLDFVDNGPRDSMAQGAVASALEQAVWDLAGRHAGVPVASLLNGDGARGIALYANINRRTVDRSPAGFVASATAAATAGFRVFKVAPFDDVTPQTVDTQEGRARIQQGMDRVAAVREAIGPDRELFVDCHWRFTPVAARQAIDALEQLHVVWFECPLPERADTIEEIAGLRRYANERGMRLAGLEELTSPAAFAPWLAAGAYDVVMPDVKYCGGIADLLAIGSDAARHRVACAPHNPTGPVCHAASLAACSALDAPVLLEHQWDETPWFFAIGGPAMPRPRRGESEVPRAPGLGVALDFTGLEVRIA